MTYSNSEISPTYKMQFNKETTILKNFSAFLLLGIIILLLSWIGMFLTFIYNISNNVKDTITSTDAIVVLTGGKHRISEGLNLLIEGKANKLLISGIGEHAGIKQLKALSEEMTPYKVNQVEEKIVLGHIATDTKGNAIETAIWMELNNFKSLRLVTSNYHIPRSILEFKAIMPNIKIIANPVSSNNVNLKYWWKSYNSAKLIFLEFNKYLFVSIENLKFSKLL